MPNSQPQLALVTDAICAAMENNLFASKMLRWMDKSESKISPTNRFQVIERVPPRFNMRTWTGAISDITAAQQDTALGAEIYALNSGVTLDYTFDDFAGIRDEDSALKNDRLRAIGQNAGEKVDAQLLSSTMLAGNNWTGTPGTAVNDIDAILDGYVRLKEEGVPDGEMFAVLPYSDMSILGKYMAETIRPAADSQAAILNTFGNNSKVKELAGMKVMFTQQVPSFVTGTRTNGTVAGAAQNVNYTAVAQSTTTNGRFLTQTINISGLGANATINDGEVFTIAGVNAWDNRKGASMGRLQQFRVVGNTVADGAGLATGMRIFPAIIVQNGTLTGDLGVNNANATVSAAPANLAVVTWVGAASSTFVQRAVIGRGVGRVISATLEDLPSGENASRKMKSVPLTLRAHRFSNGNTGVSITRFDTPYQFNTEAFGRFKVCRING